MELHLHIPYRHSIYFSVSSPLNRRLACPRTRLIVVAKRKVLIPQEMNPSLPVVLPKLSWLMRSRGHVFRTRTEREKLRNTDNKEERVLKEQMTNDFLLKISSV
jgi:hypothetical protein